MHRHESTQRTQPANVESLLETAHERGSEVGMGGVLLRIVPRQGPRTFLYTFVYARTTVIPFLTEWSARRCVSGVSLFPFLLLAIPCFSAVLVSRVWG